MLLWNDKNLKKKFILAASVREKKVRGMIENENSDVGVLLYIYTKCTSERTGNIRLQPDCMIRRAT